MGVDLITLVYFVNFFILGLFVKDQYGFAIIAGIMWEVYVGFITSWSVTRDLLIKYYPLPKEYWENRGAGYAFCDLIIMVIAYSIGNQVPISDEYLIDLNKIFNMVTEKALEINKINQ